MYRPGSASIVTLVVYIRYARGCSENHEMEQIIETVVSMATQGPRKQRLRPTVSKQWRSCDYVGGTAPDTVLCKVQQVARVWH